MIGLLRAADCSTSVLQVRFHVAPVEKARESVGDRQLDRSLNVVAQPLGIASLFDLGPHARQQLIPVNRAQQKVIDTDLQPAREPRSVVGLGNRKDRNSSGPFERADLAAQTEGHRSPASRAIQ